MDLIEANEAFAAQSLGVGIELGWDASKVNVNGGAINYYICLGLGTANSEILDYFGLSETQKDVVFTPAPAVKLHSVMKKAGEHFRIDQLSAGSSCMAMFWNIGAKQVYQLLVEAEAPVGNQKGDRQARSKAFRISP